MGRKIILDRNELYQKYITENLSQKKVADYFNVSIDTVRRNLKEYGISSHQPKDWLIHPEIVLTTRQKEIINGALLGDGCLTKPKHGENCIFCYLSKSKQHVEFVCNDFIKYSIQNGIVYSSFFDERTNTIYNSYKFRTQANIAFSKIYEKWYNNGVKIIPKDLILTPLTCLIWYIGDGCLSNLKRSQEIILATNCFSKDEQEQILLPQLQKFEAKLRHYSGEQYRIIIPRRKIQNFLNYIGECPFSDYQYKWNYKDYKNQYLPNDKKKENQIISSYLSGCSTGSIAKIFNIDRTSIIKCLQRYNINPYQNLYSRKEVIINEE